MRLMLAHMAVLNKRVMSAMVLDRLDAELDAARRMPTASAAAPDAHEPLGNKQRTLEMRCPGIFKRPFQAP